MLTPVEDVTRAFADAVVEAFAARSGPRFTLVLSGGPTARECYEVLAETGSVDWSLVDIYVGDERFVPPDDEEANQRLIHESLLDRIGAAGSFRPWDTTLPVDECVAAYQPVIGELVTGPGIDLIHLGMGPDGHTASLFDGSTALDAAANELVAANEDPSGRNPHLRLTFTLPAINSARLAVFTIAGASKADALAALLRGEDMPAARVHADRMLWLVDGPACATAP